MHSINSQTSHHFKELCILSIFIFAGFLLSLKTYLSPMTFVEMDAYNRANWGYTNLVNAQLFHFRYVGGSWLPLHPDILGLSIFFWHDPQNAPRLITFILNIFSIPLMFLFTNELFHKSKKNILISMIATIIYLFHPLRLNLATVTLSESIAYFFLLLILILCMRKKINYGFLIFLLNLSAAIRYEFWLILPIVWLIVFIDKDLNIWKKIILCGLSAIFPFYWILMSYLNSGSIFGFFSDKLFNAHHSIPVVSYFNLLAAIKGWLGTLKGAIGWSGLLVSTYGFILYIKHEQDNKRLIISILPLYFFISLIHQVFFGTMEKLPQRYLFVVIVGIIPLFSYGIYDFFQHLRKKGRILQLIIFAVALFFFVKDANNIYINSNYYENLWFIKDQEQIMEVIDFFNQNRIDYTDKKLIYASSGDSYFPMFVYFTQRHDFLEVTNMADDASRYSNENAIWIVRKEFNCPGKHYFENLLFRVCINE